MLALKMLALVYLVLIGLRLDTNKPQFNEDTGAFHSVVKRDFTSFFTTNSTILTFITFAWRKSIQ